MVDFNKTIAKSKEILSGLQYETGLFAASRKDVDTGYNAAWIRDNVYESLGISYFDKEKSLSSIHALFDAFKKHEYKIDWAIRQKPDAKFKYIHARIHPLTFEEFHEEWGNKQNDAIGAFLFIVGKMAKSNNSPIRDESDIKIVQKLVLYLMSIEYWHDEDNGIWEENEEIHASSIGACVAGLKSVENIVPVPEWLIEKGQNALNSILPCESKTKNVDLALLSLIYPYNIVSEEQAKTILKNVEKNLVRKNGVIRYIGDKYYNKGGEAEWCMGFPWLAKIYKNMGNKEKYLHYIQLTHKVMTPSGEIPELYFAGKDEYNKNTPLGWSQAMYLAAVSD